jgi:hypothetical protein
VSLAAQLRAACVIARGARALSHRPTRRQLSMLARFGGFAPRTYRLDERVEWLPECLPEDFPHGRSGLCFAHAGGALVVLPDGAAFALH